MGKGANLTGEKPGVKRGLDEIFTNGTAGPRLVIQRKHHSPLISLPKFPHDLVARNPLHSSRVQVVHAAIKSLDLLSGQLSRPQGLPQRVRHLTALVGTKGNRHI